ncbi:hypothetical protein VSU19_19690 [Verrucomicrobiales bacterium BCK34]|nr:hypothetical protein [Verrucomicrobiales bacterium BCK34]
MPYPIAEGREMQTLSAAQPYGGMSFSQTWDRLMAEENGMIQTIDMTSPSDEIRHAYFSAGEGSLSGT